MGRASVGTSGLRPASGHSSRVPCPHCIRCVPSRSQPAPESRTAARAQHGRSMPPRPSRITVPPAHPCCLWMHAVEASAGLRLQHVNHDGAQAAAGGQWSATQDLLLNHSNKTFTTYVWTQMKHLKQCEYNHCNMCNTRSTFEISRWRIWNKRLKHLKLLKHTLATCVYYHCNICKHPWSTFATFRLNTWNIIERGNLKASKIVSVMKSIA